MRFCVFRNRYALEPLTRKRDTREKVEFFKLPCHVFALRPDVGPPPVHGNGVDLLRRKLQELAAGKARDVRDRLLLVRRSILQFRENLLGLPDSSGTLPLFFCAVNVGVLLSYN